MSLVVAAYFPQPAVIWLSPEPKRHGPRSFGRRQQVGTHYTSVVPWATPTLGQFQRRLKTSLFRPTGVTLLRTR